VTAPTGLSRGRLAAPLALLGVALFALPLVALVARAPWASLPAHVASPAVHDAMRLSLVSSVAALALAVGVGLPLAIWLASGRSRLRGIVRLVVMLPVVLPPVVAGIALLLAFGRAGLVGAWLYEWFGVAVPFTTAATVIAAAYVGTPFFVLAAEAGLRALEPRYTEVAATLGAGPVRRFVRVTLPMVLPSLRSGALLCWARALGEFCATQTFAGNLAGTTRTMPLACGDALERMDMNAAVVLSLLLAGVSVAVLFLLRHALPGGGR
jgi:molybdate transport system permease protein